MKKLFFALPGNEKFTQILLESNNGEQGQYNIRQFPDNETYIQILSEVKNKEVVLVCTLNKPDHKFLPLYFLAKTTKELGAKKIILAAPYLAYMRQDKSFNPGEAITSKYFANLLSSFIDALITIDPHLHRRTSLSEIYSISTKTGHAAPYISQWIKNNVNNAVIIGPDIESEQWVSEIAIDAGVPYVILNKIRFGDYDVEISKPNLSNYLSHTPILIDDIISTGKTLIKTINHLTEMGMRSPICIGIHAVFAGNSYEQILQSGAQKVITCNTIPHQSNAINISDLFSF